MTVAEALAQLEAAIGRHGVTKAEARAVHRLCLLSTVRAHRTTKKNDNEEITQ